MVKTSGPVVGDALVLLGQAANGWLIVLFQEVNFFLAIRGFCRASLGQSNMD